MLCAPRFGIAWSLSTKTFGKHGSVWRHDQTFYSYQVENHDDFYSTEEGRTHTQDQRGYYVVYDTALKDFK